MDTVYYTLSSRKIKVSGGPDLLTVSLDAPVASPAGEVLDFDRCRRKLETKAAWRTLAQTAAEVKEPQEGAEEAVAVPRPRVRRERGIWLELWATVAVVLASVAASVAFLSVL